MAVRQASDTQGTGKEASHQEEYAQKKVSPLFIIASGPSLRKLDYSMIAGYPTMGVNYANMAINDGYDHDHPERFNWHDAKYHTTYAHWRDATMGIHMSGYQGLAIIPSSATTQKDYPPPRCEIETYDRTKTGIVGGLSGTSALHMALLKGFNPIFLIGFDCFETEDGMYGYGSKHSEYWEHNDRDGRKESLYGIYEQSISAFRDLRVHLAEPNGIEVYNLSEESMIPDFPYISLDDALEMV